MSSHKIFNIDARDMDLYLEPKSVQMCVTSPPYFGLRDYKVAGQIGLEATPDEYIAEMVRVFRKVRNVLADDGTLWLNIGDSYAGSWGNYGGGNRGKAGNQRTISVGSFENVLDHKQPRTTRPAASYLSGELKAKDLIGIPWLLAFALRADGWWLRQDIIWHKPNPMPESVRDRCTKAHEYIFLLSKSERYFFDVGAIAEPETMKPQQRITSVKTNPQNKVHQRPIYRQAEGSTGGGMRNRRSVWKVATRPYSGAHFAVFPPALIEPCILAGSMPIGAYEPSDLILSPTGEGDRLDDPTMIVGRAGWSRPRRDVEDVRPVSRLEQAAYAEQLRDSPYRELMSREAGGDTSFSHYVRTDRSGARAIPATLFDKWISNGWLTRVCIPPRLALPHRSCVLDPFMGSGTTAQVALQHGRRAVGCELNTEYLRLIDARVSA